MEKQELLYWLSKHNNDHREWLEKEKEIGNRLRETKELTKADLIKIIEWKFEGWGNVLNRELKLVAHVDEQVLKKVSNIVFNLNTDYDIERIKRLCGLDHGIGPAVASVILTFFDPENYGVFDFHVWQEVFGEKLGQYTHQNYVKLLSKLREIANEYSLKVRDVEKAFYKKNYDKSRERFVRPRLSNIVARVADIVYSKEPLSAEEKVQRIEAALRGR